jgi:hypothetical protein
MISLNHSAMRGRTRTVLAVVLASVVVAQFCAMSMSISMAHGQSLEATIYKPCTVTLRSTKAYTNPHRDVRIRAVFTHSTSSQTIAIDGFWNGTLPAAIPPNTASSERDREYLVRFAPPTAGRWTYRITASDTANVGLHNRVGILNAAPYIGNNLLYSKGALRVAANKRNLAFADGTPFFWLGDTAWEIANRATMDEVRRFIADRAQKGFTVVQMVPTSHNSIQAFGVRNRMGETSFIAENRSMPNPRYFDMVDSIVQRCNDAGVIAALVPQWASGQTALNFRSEWFPLALTNDEVRTLARYIAARYAAYNVVWIIGGDIRYDTPERRAFWQEIAEIVQSADGRQHLCTIHPEGFSGSYDFFDSGANAWLDFNMLQSSHQFWSKDRTDLVQRGYAQRPPKPVLNAEPPYEDIQMNFFLSDFLASFIGGKPLASAYDVRLSAYMSIFSGSLVGITYGANGIWQWNSATYPNAGFNPRLTVDSAMQLPGASHMTILKTTLLQYDWGNCEPRPDLLSDTDTDSFVAVVASRDALLAYCGKQTRSLTLQTAALRGEGGLVVEWINPATGTITRRERPFSFTPLTFRLPTNDDWLVGLRRLTQSIAVQRPTDTTKIALSLIRADRANGRVEFVVNVPEAGALSVDVVNSAGASVLRQNYAAAQGEFYISLPIAAAGAYFYRLRFDGTRIATTLTGSFVQE